nr:hypothetical protein HUO10_003320 [Paraburkholderia busanensis]
MSFGDDRPKQLSDQNSLGTQLGANAADKIGFFGQTPAAQNGTPAGNVHTVTAGSTTTVFVNTSFDGSIGTSAYTIGDIVAALKTLGILKS